MNENNNNTIQDLVDNLHESRDSQNMDLIIENQQQNMNLMVENQQVKEAMERLKDQKDRHIQVLFSKIKELTKKNKQLIKENKEFKQKNNEMAIEINQLKKKLAKFENKNEKETTEKNRINIQNIKNTNFKNKNVPIFVETIFKKGLNFKDFLNCSKKKNISQRPISQRPKTVGKKQANISLKSNFDFLKKNNLIK